MKINKLLNCDIVKLLNCYIVILLVLSGCTQRAVESDLDWPVAGVTTINDNSQVEVADEQRATTTVKIIKPPAVGVKAEQENEAGQVEIIEPPAVALENYIPESDSGGSRNVMIDSPVPFAPQAPYAVWDELHNEACEEAAMIMADAWFKNKKLDTHEMEQAILNLVKWEEQNGFNVDVTATETAKILVDYFNLSAKVETEVTIQKIKQEISAGKLIIIPAAGRLLGNPYYRRPGPLYHMLVVRGYDESRGEFITNDPGTRRGEAYRYKYETLINAIHDWPKPGKTKDDVTETEMNNSQKIIISVSKI